jgi:hypothetical protein
MPEKTRAAAAGAFNIVTGDVERLGGRPPGPFRDVLAGALKSPSACRQQMLKRERIQPRG